MRKIYRMIKLSGKKFKRKSIHQFKKRRNLNERLTNIEVKQKNLLEI
jgi:hypothetical protein